MKVFIGGELEHSISDKFRKARNSVIEYMDCLCDISYINELSFYVFCLKGFTRLDVSAGEYMSFRIISYESRLIACYSSNVILSLVWMV